MSEEEYIRKAVRNVMEKLADNPDEMLSLSNLQEKYNNLLVEKIELQQERDKYKEVIEEVREYIEETISYKEILARDNWEFRVKTMLEILDKAKE